jgi:hypothetical protein
MTTLYCWSCGLSYKKGAVQFCPQCGKPLPERYDLIDEIKILKNEPAQYKLLRILGGFLTILGIILILTALVATPLAYKEIHLTVSSIQPTVLDGKSADFPGIVAFWLTMPTFVLIFLSGLGWIVIAQIIQVIVSTFDQTKESSRLMRRLALMLSEDS